MRGCNSLYFRLLYKLDLNLKLLNYFYLQFFISFLFSVSLFAKIQVWDLALLGKDEFLVAGSNDSELLVWSLQRENSTSQNNEDHENPFNVSKFD